MSWDNARDALDEIHRRRFGRDLTGVLDVAEEVWAAATDWDPEQRVGLASLCQTTFVALVDAGDPDSLARAPLWRARATRVAAETGELATAAMLLVPIAHDAADRGYVETALAVLDEVGAVADEVERRGEGRTGPPLSVLRRAHLEKQGHILWRVERYAEAVEKYQGAAAVARPGRDALRVAGGLLLARLGLQVERGEVIERADAAAELQAIADAAFEAGWNDVAEPARRSAVLLLAPGAIDVQRLAPFEIERTPAKPA